MAPAQAAAISEGTGTSMASAAASGSSTSVTPAVTALGGEVLNDLLAPCLVGGESSIDIAACAEGLWVPDGFKR